MKVKIAGGDFPKRWLNLKNPVISLFMWHRMFHVKHMTQYIVQIYVKHINITVKRQKINVFYNNFKQIGAQLLPH